MRKASRNKLFDLELEVLATRRTLSPPDLKKAHDQPLAQAASACYDAGSPIQLTYRRGMYQSAQSFSSAGEESGTSASAYPDEALSYYVESYEQPGEEDPAVTPPRTQTTAEPDEQTDYGHSASSSDSDDEEPDEAESYSVRAWSGSQSVAEPTNIPRPPATPEESQAATEADEFLQELQSIMKGETAYDPQTKQVRPANEAPPSPAPDAAPPAQLASAHSIFDQIAANMSTAQAFNLGAYDLEKSLDVIEQRFERQQKAVAPQSTFVAAQTYVEPLSALEIAEYLSETNAVSPGPDEPADPHRAIYANAESDVSMAFTVPDSAPVTPAFLTSIASQTFSSGAEVNAYFQTRFQQDFLTWFHDHAGNRLHWAGRNCLTNADTQQHFTTVWNAIPVMYGRSSINLMEFLSLASIIINETGGTFTPITERVNGPAHPVAPGIAYAFNAIPGLKASYNTLSGNKTAYELFNTAEFLTAHRSRPLLDRVRNTTDVRWRGTRYPCAYTDAERATPPAGGFFPVSTDPAQSGIILETDFYKFRGRGLIQTTSRGNYKPLIQFVQNYTGTQPVMLEYARNWHGLSLDSVANVSTNANWDILFQQTDAIIPAVGISLHSGLPGNNYLTMPLTVAGLNGDATGSIYHMGRRISGGATYAKLFKNRVLQLVSLLA